MDTTETVTLVLIVLTLLSGLLARFKIKKCNSICCDSDCRRKEGEPDSPDTLAPVYATLSKLAQNNNNLNEHLTELEKNLVKEVEV